LTLALLPTGLVSAQRPGTVDPEGGTGDPTEEDWLEQQKEVPDEDTEEAWMKEEDAKVDTEVTLHPGTEGAAASPPPPTAVPSMMDDPGGMDQPGVTSPAGTEAFERERMRGGPSGVSTRAQRRQEGEDMIPLQFKMHGYYRARYNWIGNAPIPRTTTAEYPSGQANYGYMRLRIDPELTYGPNPDLPIARLRFTVDGFDNVVFGDNARVFSTPLFAVDQSATTVDGFDLKETLKLERAWIEFLVPIGQIRVGRMESQWGVGLLTHAGNGLADWGDFLRGETFDRILFATRPITLARAIATGDSRQTPLIFAFVYDRLSQDPVVDSTISVAAGAATDPQFRPFYSTFDTRYTAPFAYLTNLDRRTSEIVGVLAWFDEESGTSEDDELFVGLYTVYRWQRSTESRITIPDLAVRLQHTVGDKGRAFTLEGEFFAILGHSGGLAFTGGCPPAPCNRGTAHLYNVLGRIGVKDPGQWDFRVEGGFASGDTDILFNDDLTTRGFNTNVKVGLLMYQVALYSLGWNQLAPLNAQELGPNGSVWNSKYLYPQFRFEIISGLEAHATFLVGWAHKLDQIVYGAVQDSCGFKNECFLGWELNGALRARIGQDIVWTDLELGVMQPGQALKNAGLNDRFLWTVQLRAAMVF
jgi:hypothetical protein